MSIHCTNTVTWSCPVLHLIVARSGKCCPHTDAVWPTQSDKRFTTFQQQTPSSSSFARRGHGTNRHTSTDSWLTWRNGGERGRERERERERELNAIYQRLSNSKHIHVIVTNIMCNTVQVMYLIHKIYNKESKEKRKIRHTGLPKPWYKGTIHIHLLFVR